MKREKSGALHRLMKCIDLPEFVAGTDECIEIRGGNTVQIEGAKGIHTYEKEVVKVDMKKYLLVIRGSEFDLAHFGTEGLRVIGHLRMIEWEAK